MNLTLVTSGVSLMHMHVQNLLGNDYSVTHFSYSKLTFLTRNLHFLLETHFFNSEFTFLTRNSLSLLDTRYSTKSESRSIRAPLSFVLLALNVQQINIAAY